MSELFGRAKSLGAVCIKNDMLHLPLVRSKSIDYFLIDLEPSRNLSILAALLNNTNTKKERLWPKRSDIYGSLMIRRNTIWTKRIAAAVLKDT